MKDIKRISIKSLLGCIFLFLISIAMLGLFHYTSYENIFIPPPNFENMSTTALAESNDLESLKNACLFWAQNNDVKSKLIDEMLENFNALFFGVLFWTVFLSVCYGWGYMSIIRKIREYENGEQFTP